VPSNVEFAIIGAAGGSLCTGVVGYILWQVRRPVERRDSLMQKKMHDRWDASVTLKSSLAELEHARQHIVRGEVGWVEKARRHRQRARECARASVPLLGEDVKSAVIDYTDVCEEVFGRTENGDGAEPDLDRRGHETRRTAYRAIEEALKSLPAA
jgi:hypothetical protein